MDWFFDKLFTLLAFALDMFMFLTFPLYILVLITLWKNRKEETLKHAFFKLMFSIGIADIGTILNTFFCFRLPEWGYIPEVFIWLGGMSARICYLFAYFWGDSQALAVLVVAFNRYTAYMMPLQHRKLWRDGKLVVWSIAGIWIISFILITPIMFIFEFRIYISPDDNRTIYQQWEYASDLLFYSIPITIVGKGLIVLIVFVMYGKIFIATFRKNRQSTRVITANEKAALNMAIVGFIHCIGLAIAVYFFIALEIAWFGFEYNLLDTKIVVFINNLGYGLFSAINPYALLILSASVRRHFMKMYHIPTFTFPCLKKNVIHVTELTSSEANINQQVEL